MASGLIVSDLLLSIRRRAAIPTTAVTGSADADLLAYANEELKLFLAADILRVREEYFAFNSDATLSGTAYRVPYRAIGGKLRMVATMDDSDNIVEVLPRIEPERLVDLTGTGNLIGFYVDGGYIRLVPTATTSATQLRLAYHIRPNALASSGTQAVTAINTTTKVVTVASTTGYSTSLACDFVAGKPGYHHLADGIDLTPTATTSTTLTFATLPSTLAVGDYVCLAETTPYAQVPAEFHPVLAQRTAVRLLEAGGYAEQLGQAQKTLADMEAAVGILTTPRVDASPQKIINRYGALSGNGWRYRYGP